MLTPAQTAERIGTYVRRCPLSFAERVMSSQAVLMRINAQDGFTLLLAVLFCFFQTNAAIAQQTGSSKKNPNTQGLVARPADLSSSSSRARRTRAEVWFPPDIDRVVPEVTPGATCPLSDVLSEAGKQNCEAIYNRLKFTATRVGEHQHSGRSGRQSIPGNRKSKSL